MIILKIAGIIWLILCTVLTMFVGRKLMKNANSHAQFYAGFALTMCSLIIIGACMVFA